MKRLFLGLLFTSFISFSQSTESLKIAVKKLYEANYLMDFEVIASHSYLAIIEPVVIETLLKDIEKHYENDEFRLRLQLETVSFQYGEIKKIEAKSFCVISFRNPIRYFFENKLTAATALEKTALLKKINKTKEVVFEPKRNSFNVKKITTYVAVMDETTSNKWRFLNFDNPTEYQIFKSFFGESIQKELGL